MKNLKFKIIYYFNINKIFMPNKFLIFNLLKKIFIKNKKNINITINIIDKKTIKNLNFKYKKRKKYTNILTFKSPVFFSKKINIEYLDFYICKDIIKNESIKYKKDIYIYWIHIITHGCLHILGYKHNNNKKKKIDYMYKKELKIISSL